MAKLIATTTCYNFWPTTWIASGYPGDYQKTNLDDDFIARESAEAIVALPYAWEGTNCSTEIDNFEYMFLPTLLTPLILIIFLIIYISQIKK